MELKSLQERALVIRQKYGEWERQQYGRSWTTDEIALGFMGDVGDLAKLIMAHKGIRNIDRAEDKLAHELADCLWAIIVLADACNVDLEQAFLQTMTELEQSLDKRLS
ncbi:MAG: nucleotide pyrophosphohydrolase [Chloroflexota bacterium]